MSTVRYENEGDVVVLTLANPPVNCVSHATRLALADALERADMDDHARAIVLIGSGKAFCGGADLAEFETPFALAAPSLHDAIIDMLEAMSKPIVAAIHGFALGGGLELALACHYRVAEPNAKLGLPEVTLGFMPGAGGTQRLPRAIGLEAALNMILSGNSVSARNVVGTELIRETIDSDLRAGAITFARRISGVRPLPRLRDRSIDYPNAAALFQFVRGIVKSDRRAMPGALPSINAIETAMSKPIDEALNLEFSVFKTLAETTEAKALRYGFLAKRNAERIADLCHDAPTREIRSAAVIGAGTMGGGIAMCFAEAGIPVTVVDVTQEALDRGIATVRRNYEVMIKRGRLSKAEYDERMDLVQSTCSYQAIRDADIVIEAAFEDLGVKEKVFRQLDTVMKPGAILATNTSSLDVNQIALFTKRPRDVIGTHFFSPANVMRLLEVVHGKSTALEVLASVMMLAKRLRKTAVVSRVCDGFIGNRMIDQYMRQAMFLLDEGALPWEVDRALEQWGMAMGPFRVYDLVGNDVPWMVRKRRYVEHPEVLYSRVGDKLCECGWLGQKTGRGWYLYEPGEREPRPSPEVAELIEAHSDELGIKRRVISADEIVGRCIYALVNEGAAILEEGIAQRASDIDVVYLAGYGFPARRGGPMFYADTVGLVNVLRTMRRWAKDPHGDPMFWKPAALLTRLAAAGNSISGS